MKVKKPNRISHNHLQDRLDVLSVVPIICNLPWDHQLCLQLLMLLLLRVGGCVAPLAADLHHPGTGLDVGAVGVVSHVGHADERVVQSLAWGDTAFLLNIKKMFKHS